jgi:cytochrome oxidase Cu insertion factor (SCO1/SenC/PrrC family)
MGELALVMKELGTDADKLQVLFVTVDSERDTAAVLSQYVPEFHPSFLGLYGDAAAAARAAKEFKVFFQKQPVSGGYSGDHSAGHLYIHMSTIWGQSWTQFSLALTAFTPEFTRAWCCKTVVRAWNS